MLIPQIKRSVKPKAATDYTVDIFDAPDQNTPLQGDIGSLGQLAIAGRKPKLGANAYKAVKDPYSGQYYGESDVGTFNSKFTEEIGKVQKSLDYYNNPNNRKTMADPRQNALGANGFSLDQFMKYAAQPLSIQSRAKYVAESTSKLNTLQAKSTEFSNAGYEKQEKQFFKSYNMYQEGWNESFKGKYQNPRLDEDSRNRKARGKQKYQSAMNAAEAGALSADGVSIRKRTNGTGIATSAYNPFSSTGAGIGV